MSFCVMMTSRRVVVVAGILISILVVYILVSNFQDGRSTEMQADTEVDESEFVPEGWTGLPISAGNVLYKDPNSDINRFKAGYLSLRKILILMSASDWDSADDTWELLINKYEKIIGWNGIFDAIDAAQTFLKKETVMRLHKLGEVLYAHAPRPRYAVEISSRNMLHKAPLHGSVWEAIAAVGTSDTQKLFDLVHNELCYFREEENMGNIWISCAHGVGHGLGDLYGTTHIDKALEMCAKQEDLQFQYACATGVFMSLENEYPMKTFSPCDKNRFPGACYRFKNRLFTSIFYNETYPCRTQSDEYHVIGCIWGSVYVNHGKATDYYERCLPYMPEGNFDPYGVKARRHAACMDGLFSALEVSMLRSELKENMCSDIQHLPLSLDICIKRKTQSFQIFTFESEDDFYYNTNVLEHDPQSITPAGASWLSVWNNIVPHMAQPQNQHLD